MNDAHNPQTTTFNGPLEAATQAVFDCVMPDQDPLAVLIHESDLVSGTKPITDQIDDVMRICQMIAKAALDAAREYEEDRDAA